MNTFEINKDVLRKAWSGENQYWLSLKDFKLKDIGTLSQMDKPFGVSPTAYLVSIGYIPFLTVSNEEVMHAYVETLSNQKLKNAFSKIDEANYVESFWKYFNIYPELSNGYNDFEDDYVLKKTKKWCNENSIKYSV